MVSSFLKAQNADPCVPLMWMSFLLDLTILTETITSDKMKSQDLGLSLFWITKAKAKKNLWDLIYFS